MRPRPPTCPRRKMSDPLGTYLSDHAAGARGAVQLLEYLRDHREGEEVGRFAAALLADVESDRRVLVELLERIGRRGTARLKESISSIAEKLAHLKPHGYAAEGLGTLLALESLEMGIDGKRGLWSALRAAAADDTRLRGIDYDDLIQRAQDQHRRVEKMRLDVARAVLQPDDS